MGIGPQRALGLDELRGLPGLEGYYVCDAQRSRGSEGNPAFFAFEGYELALSVVAPTRGHSNALREEDDQQDQEDEDEDLSERHLAKGKIIPNAKAPRIARPPLIGAVSRPVTAVTIQPMMPPRAAPAVGAATVVFCESTYSSLNRLWVSNSAMRASVGRNHEGPPPAWGLSRPPH